MKELWEAQKRCEAGRAEWLEREVRKRVQAAGDDNWKRNLTEMTRVTERRSINMKLTVITKGNNAVAFDRIKIATHDWFHSK